MKLEFPSVSSRRKRPIGYSFVLVATLLAMAGEADVSGWAPLPPGRPQNLTAAPEGPTQIRLSWEHPAGTVTGYELQWSSDGATGWTLVNPQPRGRVTTYSDTVERATTRYYRVRAVNLGIRGPWSEVASASTDVPQAPVDLRAEAGDRQVTLSWRTASSGFGITAHEVRYRAHDEESEGVFGHWRTIPESGEGERHASSYLITGLTNATTYTLALRARNGVGTGAETQVTAIPHADLYFAHFANGENDGLVTRTELVLVNVETSTAQVAVYFYDPSGEVIAADSLVATTDDLKIMEDGALVPAMEIEPLGEITVSTHGEGDLRVGSIRVSPSIGLGGALRFDIPTVGVAGGGPGAPVSDAIFPARRQTVGINTGTALRNLGADPLTVACHLMRAGEVLHEMEISLAGHGQSSQFINEMFPEADTSEFYGSVRCMTDEGGKFTGLALVEMDSGRLSGRPIFTTLPLVPVDSQTADDGESVLHFAHFVNGDFAGMGTRSDLLLVNVANTAVAPVIYFYDQDGEIIAADSLVNGLSDGLEVAGDGALTVREEIPPLGERTIPTSGLGDGVIGSVRVVSDGPLGGVLRFDVPGAGIAGLGSSEAVAAAAFPVRRMADGINTGLALRNMEVVETIVACSLMRDGEKIAQAEIPLAGNGQDARFLHELFPEADTDDFEGSAHCQAAAGDRFIGVALELDLNHRVFTTMPAVPAPARDPE